jgi:hypothetical protein
MRKHFAPTICCRPILDSLEDRCLPSGGIEVIGVAASPAIVVQVDIPENVHPLDASRPTAIPLLWRDVAYGPMSGPQLGQAFTRWSDSAPLHPAFELISGFQSVQPYGFPGPMTGEIPPAPMIAGEMDAMPHDLLHVPPPPSVLAARFELVASEWLPGDFRGMKLDENVLHVGHLLVGKVVTDQTAVDFSTSGDGSQSTGGDGSQLTSVAPVSNQPTATVQGAGGSSSIQTGPASVSAPRATAPPSPSVMRGEEWTRIGRTDEATGNQAVESVQASPPRAVAASLVMTQSQADAVTQTDRPVDVVAPASAEAGGVRPEELPLPHRAGLLANAIPLDQASLEHAVDEFFNQLDGLGMGQLVEQGPSRIVPLSLALLGAVSAVEVARRRLRVKAGDWRPTSGQNPLGSEELLGFPELPGSWSTRLT